MHPFKSLLFFLCFIILSGLFILDVSAQQIEIASSPNPVGSGARAMGMGGAFIGVADDATAASWNPAGLIQLERPEISAVYSYYGREESYTSDVRPESEGTNSMSSGSLNYLSIAYPFQWLKKNMIITLNYQRMYDFNKDIDFDYNWNIDSDMLKDHIHFEQEGGLKTISPAFAVQITPWLYVGMTFNIWEDIFGHNGWEEKYHSSPSGMISGNPVDMRIDYKDRYTFSGYNMHFGFLWNINNMFTLGGVYKTEFTADVKRKLKFNQSQTYSTLPPEYSSESHIVHKEDMELDMPDSYGIGLAVRFSDNFTAAIDVCRTEWGKYILTDEDGHQTRPITGEPKSKTSVKPTHQVRLGGEYLFIKENTVIPVRAGIFYDPEPSENSPEDYYGCSVGSGFKWKNLLVDAAYQYRFGDDVEGDVIGIPGTKADVQQHLVLVSALFHF